jgi:hypothetical protein
MICCKALPWAEITITHSFSKNRIYNNITTKAKYEACTTYGFSLHSTALKKVSFVSVVLKVSSNYIYLFIHSFIYNITELCITVQSLALLLCFEWDWDFAKDLITYDHDFKYKYLTLRMYNTYSEIKLNKCNVYDYCFPNIKQKSRFNTTAHLNSRLGGTSFKITARANSLDSGSRWFPYSLLGECQYGASRPTMLSSASFLSHL